MESFLKMMGAQGETIFILAISFIILVLLLNKFLFKPLLKYLDERNKGIKETYEKIEATNQDLKRMGEEYQTRLTQIEKTAYNKIQEAIKEGLVAKSEIISTAHDQANKTIRKATEEIEMEKKKALVTIKQEVVNLSVAIATKVVEQKMDEVTHHRVAEKFFKELEQIDIEQKR